MPRTDNEIRIVPSVLDRLIDNEPEMSQEAPSSRSKSLRQLKESVKRDLEWLLNTRKIQDWLPPDLQELNSSLAAYGLPDFSSFSVKTPSDQNRIRRALEEVIRIFEPRLEAVAIKVEPMRDGERVIRFRIDAQLKVEPAPEPITFDTVLQLASSRYVVQEE